MSIGSSGYESLVEKTSTDHSSTCSPSTSRASSPSFYIHRCPIRKMKRKMSRSRYLLAIEGRNRLRKLAAHKVRLASNAVSAISLLRWEEKIDRKYEKEFEHKRVGLERLMRENDVLRANQRTFTEGCSILESYAMVLRAKLDQEVRESALGFSSSKGFFSPHS
ncbi:hypothetical protein DICVIV_00883 [Dictyocaulus viviparus]|uniref:Uncharacterized protein n=1 Tax=Dictyocaulus viviparus TaxID=29172 RepID=A0A0D8YEE7_DICVI|nr:hypothetical protein DICVIV_00883 [Dictyocaulus viviparus]